MKFEHFDLKNIEPELVDFWKKQDIIGKLRKRNKKGDPFYFLDGPPYTSGRIHLGHAWNKALKDMVLRYKRMQGFDVWDRAGFDMHGLPTEHKVMAKFNLKNKEDIKNFGYEKFSKECYNFCTEMMHAMITDFERMGASLDFSDPDQPIKNERMEAVWKFIKKAHKDKRLYLGKRTLHWDPKDQSALAKHELEYKSITDTSIYVKFKVENAEKSKISGITDGDKENEYVLIWTTTPWTIPLNLFVMAHPDLDYVRVKVENEVWIMAKSLVESVMNLAGKEFEIIEEFKGERLEGVKYEHFWTKDIKDLQTLEKENDKVHTILLNKEYVTDADGTGLVHGAPGCGPEDYEVGHLNGIPPLNDIDESGKFPESMGFAKGWLARTDDPKFIEAMESLGAIVAKKKYRHDYPHAERSKEPVIFRTTPQWFLKIEDLKDDMLAGNEDVNWYPESAKNAFRSWLKQARDNSITKQRFWGTPVPIWRSEDGDIIVVGSKEELEKLAKNKVPEDLHKPWIDEVIIEKDGKEYRRLPDVLDVWIDPGCQSWIMLGQKNMGRYFPPDFIVEGKDHIRAWFYLLWICGYLYLEKPSFKNVYMHGFLTDVEGVKMSKSLGNIISPYEVIEKHGADTLRYYCVQQSAGVDMNFSWQEIKLKERNFGILWNVHKFLLGLSKEVGLNPFLPAKPTVSGMVSEAELYILSRLHSTIKQVTQLFDSYMLDETVPPLESLFLDLSRGYIQMVRETSSTGSKEQKQAIVYTLAEVLLDTLKMLSPIAPFTSEAIYLNLKEEFDLREESIHHFSWPRHDNERINPQLEEDFALAGHIIQAALNAREKLKRGLRWPLQEMTIVTHDPKILTAVERLGDVLRSQLNVKSVVGKDSLPEVSEHFEPDLGVIGKQFGKGTKQVTQALKKADPKRVLLEMDEKGSWGEHKLTRSHLKITRTVPSHLADSEFKQGTVYLSKEVSDELEAEGFAREVVRRVQQLRKDSALLKTDMITLYIQTDEFLKNMLDVWAQDIIVKVGAQKLSIELVPPAKKFPFEIDDNVKEHEFSLFMEKN